GLTGDWISRPDRARCVRITASPSRPATDGPSISPEATVGTYLRWWLAHIAARVRRVTYEGYEGLLRLHALPTLGPLRLNELRPLHLQSLYSDLLAPRGDRRALSA